MKKVNILIVSALLASYSLQIIGMEFKQAIFKDVVDVVDLINTHAYKDSDKIVIVPEEFRSGYIQDAIDAGRLFVACHNEKIIGYKKLFCITDDQERDDILGSELRCKETTLVASSLVSTQGDLTAADLSAQAVAKLFAAPVTYIYSGADFTHPDYRTKGVNGQLTSYALTAIKQTVLEAIAHKHSTHVAMVYGLTRSNAGKESDVLDGRTRGIMKQFVPFAQTIAQAVNCTSPSTVLLSRHHAFKPSFDPKATECRPLSDEQSIPGYGCLMACELTQQMQ